MKRLGRWWGIVLLLITALACDVPLPTSEPLTVIDPVEEVQTLELDGAERATVRLRLISEQLTVHTAEGPFLQGRFYYNVAEWSPSVKQDRSGDVSRITLSQGLGSQIPLGNGDYTNVWDVGLRRGVPIDLGVDMGSGSANLHLGGLSLSALGITTVGADLSLGFAEPNPEPLSTLRVTAGTGKFIAAGLGNANFDRLTVTGGTGTIDMSFDGAWRRSALADVKAGAGRITLRVPATLGVRVTFASSPISSVETTGFTERQENVYVNAAYGQAPLTLTINVTAGVGSISLISQ